MLERLQSTALLFVLLSASLSDKLSLQVKRKVLTGSSSLAEALYNEENAVRRPAASTEAEFFYATIH